MNVYHSCTGVGYSTKQACRISVKDGSLGNFKTKSVVRTFESKQTNAELYIGVYALRELICVQSSMVELPSSLEFSKLGVIPNSYVVYVTRWHFLVTVDVLMWRFSIFVCSFCTIK